MKRVLLARTAALWPGPASVDEDLRQSLGFLGWDVTGEAVHRASYATGTAVALLALGLAAVPAIPPVVAVPPLAVGVVVVACGPVVPGMFASAKRGRALGAAPALVTRAALSMALAPSPERAAAFAADASDGPLARSLGDHVRRSASGPGTGFATFADEWCEWLPELERSLSLVESAGAVPPDQRSATLDRARSAVLDASRDRMAEFAASIRGPATALYAFGVLLPLALVSLLPAVRAAGVSAPLPLIVAVYDVLLPLGLVAASAWLIAHRPVAFPPPTVDRTHPEVPSGSWRPAVAGLVVAAIAAVSAMELLPPWTPPIATVGTGAGAALVVRYRPVRALHASVDDVEEGLSDALALLGRRVERGESVEAALPSVANELPGPTGDVLSEAARRQRRLGLDVESAFCGPRGALSTVPSDRARSAATLLALAATEGRPAGEAVTAMGDHIQELAAVEAEARRSVEQVTSTLSNTAAVFGPLVGGATVALASTMGAAGPLAGATDAGGLALVVGTYVLIMAVVLTGLATSLSHGFDRAVVGYRVGVALLAATATYLTAAAGTALFV